jgi:hypothetical protein
MRNAIYSQTTHRIDILYINIQMAHTGNIQLNIGPLIFFGHFGSYIDNLLSVLRREASLPDSVTRLPSEDQLLPTRLKGSLHLLGHLVLLDLRMIHTFYHRDFLAARSGGQAGGGILPL